MFNDRKYSWRNFRWKIDKGNLEIHRKPLYRREKSLKYTMQECQEKLLLKFWKDFLRKFFETFLWGFPMKKLEKLRRICIKLKFANKNTCRKPRRMFKKISKNILMNTERISANITESNYWRNFRNNYWKISITILEISKAITGEIHSKISSK